MVNKTTEKDLGFKRIISELKKAENSFVTVGIHQKKGEKKYDNGATVVLVGATHEFGTNEAGRGGNVTIPERSWLRSTFDENRKDWQKLTKKLYDSVLTGKSTTQKVLNQLGLVMMEKIKAKLITGDSKWPALKPKTKARKTSTQTLIDSRKLLNSINFETKIK